MPSTNSCNTCVLINRVCVKNLTLRTAKLWFLLSSVFLNNFLTQFLALFNTGCEFNFTPLNGGLYTQHTTITINTII